MKTVEITQEIEGSMDRAGVTVKFTGPLEARSQMIVALRIVVKEKDLSSSACSVSLSNSPCYSASTVVWIDADDLPTLRGLMERFLQALGEVLNMEGTTIFREVVAEKTTSPRELVVREA